MMTTSRVVLFSLLLAFPTFSWAEKPAPAPTAEQAAVVGWKDLLGPILTDSGLKKTDISVYVANARTGEEVFSQGPDALVPASTMKVLTAATALKKLGPSFSFATEVYVDAKAEPDVNGVLKSNVYVKGYGDPTLVVERLWKLVYELKLRGITKIEGDLVFDESYMSSDYLLPGWKKPEDMADGPSYFPSLGALSLNFNTVTLVMGPGEVGKPARVLLETAASSYVTVESSLVTGKPGSRKYLKIDRELEEEGKVVFKVSGSWPSDAALDKEYRAIPDPTAHFMAAWSDMMASHGISHAGKSLKGLVPKTADRVVLQRSAPLTTILMDMNKYSNNYIAELVLRAVAAETTGVPGTTEAGATAVHDYLVSLGIPESEFHLVNGSGLSRDAKLKAGHLTAVLVDMFKDTQVGSEFRTTLSIAGRDGTLMRRLTDSPGRLRGKTGTIDGIHCLTGYVEGGDGEMYAFAFMVNDIRGSVQPIRRAHDRLVRQLMERGNGVVAGDGE